MASSFQAHYRFGYIVIILVSLSERSAGVGPGPNLDHNRQRQLTLTGWVLDENRPGDSRRHESWIAHWKQVGWNPQILDVTSFLLRANSTNSTSGAGLSHLSQIIDETVDTQQRNMFKRWMAMIHLGGGWMASLDLWPLAVERLVDPLNGASNQTVYVRVYEAIAPSLVWGSREAYLAISEQLAHTMPAKNGVHNFWTDTLGLVDLFHEQSQTLRVRRQVVTPDVHPSKACRAAALHVSPTSLQRANNLMPDQRWSTLTSQVAEQWISLWHQYCTNQQQQALEVRI